MPWYIIVYFLIVLFLAIAGIFDDYSDRKPFWLLTIALISEAVIALLFISYWYSAYIPEEKVILQFLFVSAVLWQTYSIYSDISSERASEDTNGKPIGLGATIIGSSISLLTILPAIIVAGIVAFQ